jgi:hypothetical protein
MVVHVHYLFLPVFYGIQSPFSAIKTIPPWLLCEISIVFEKTNKTSGFRRRKIIHDRFSHTQNIRNHQQGVADHRNLLVYVVDANLLASIVINQLEIIFFFCCRSWIPDKFEFKILC